MLFQTTRTKKKIIMTNIKPKKKQKVTIRQIYIISIGIISLYCSLLYYLHNNNRNENNNNLSAVVTTTNTITTIRRKKSIAVKEEDTLSSSSSFVTAKAATAATATTGKSSSNNKKNSNNKNDNNIITIGYASTVTQCNNDDSHHDFIEGAAILQHSIHLNSIRNNNNNNNNTKSKYDYQMYILYHPIAKKCVLPLKQLGFILIERNTPIDITKFKYGDGTLQERISKNGCCGEKELIKLEAYTLIQHPIIVHLDLDTLFLQPIDELYDLILNSINLSNEEYITYYTNIISTFNNLNNFNSNDENENENENEKTNTNDTSNNNNNNNNFIMWPNVLPLPKPINFMYTKDYNVVAPRRKDKPTQGGLLILRPNKTIYNDMINILQDGNYTLKNGWGNHVGPFYGGMTIQGFLTYYYEWLHPSSNTVILNKKGKTITNKYNITNNSIDIYSGNSIELNRCIYNQMVDNPYNERNNICKTGNTKTCQDCRLTNIQNIKTIHYTICLKPWWCIPHYSNIHTGNTSLCHIFHHKWFEIRSKLEVSWNRSKYGNGTYDKNHFYGYCNKPQKAGYIPIQQPYGRSIQSIKSNPNQSNQSNQSINETKNIKNKSKI